MTYYFIQHNGRKTFALKNYPHRIPDKICCSKSKGTIRNNHYYYYYSAAVNDAQSLLINRVVCGFEEGRGLVLYTLRQA